MVDRPMSPSEIKSVKQSTAVDILNNRVIPDLKKSEDLPYKADMQDANGAKIDKKAVQIKWPRRLCWHVCI